MTHPDDPTPPSPSRVDLANVTIGAAVSAILVLLLGFGVMVAVTVLTTDEGPTADDGGASIGGALLATAGSLTGVALAALFTARRARRRGSRAMVEGLLAGPAGFLVATAVGALALAGYLYAARGAPPYILLVEALSLLTLLPLAVVAAAGGAAVGALWR
jgi:hypothetical protein